jgi:hypothetical protein
MCVYVEANPLIQTLYLSPPFFAGVRYDFKQQPPSPWDRSIQNSFALKSLLRLINSYLQDKIQRKSFKELFHIIIYDLNSLCFVLIVYLMELL